MNPDSPQTRNALLSFLAAPFQARTYGNLLYLALAFPLGLAYFIFLVTGLSLGIGLTLIWIGLPILALVFAGSWGCAALERWTAIHLLGAEVPPMLPPPPVQPEGFWKNVRAFLANPVTWKGLSYLLVLKLPLGIVTFTLSVALVALSGGLLAAPLLYRLDGVEYVIVTDYWVVDTFGEAMLCFAAGIVVGLISLNVLNGLALGWRYLASAMLGSRRFERGSGGGAGPGLIPEAAPA